MAKTCAWEYYDSNYMTTLAELFTDCAKYADLKVRLEGDGDSLAVTSIAYDSRVVESGGLFVALRGQHSDGHDFVDAAIEKGAAAVVVDDRFISTGAKIGIPYLTVKNTRAALPFLASAFYGHPSQHFDLIGVTGTNGKTTTTCMIAGILHTAGYKTAVIGTVGVYVDGESVETHWSVSTTPESSDLQALFADFVDRGVQKVVMEVTSIAIDQERTACCAFDTAVFTNFTQDHLDYHHTMDEYRASKERLFVEYARRYAKPGFDAVINIDDETGRRFAEVLKKDARTVVTYGARSQNADLLAQAIDALPNGTRFHAYERRPRQRAYSIVLSIGGLFNVYNGLAAIAVARLRDIDPAVVQQGLATMMAVPGRFEPVRTGDKGFHVLVDYAHTSDGLDNVLRSALALKPTRVIAVFGCGGNRDTGKRPLMGKIAVDLADRVIVTSDNPRREQPGAIIADILAGIDGGSKHPKVIVEPDRRAAIRIALCREARPGDVVVIAGKGHETYQLVGDQALPFDDRTVAAEVLAECE